MSFLKNAFLLSTALFLSLSDCLAMNDDEHNNSRQFPKKGYKKNFKKETPEEYKERKKLSETKTRQYAEKLGILGSHDKSLEELNKELNERKKEYKIKKSKNLKNSVCPNNYKSSNKNNFKKETPEEYKERKKLSETKTREYADDLGISDAYDKPLEEIKKEIKQIKKEISEDNIMNIREYADDLDISGAYDKPIEEIKKEIDKIKKDQIKDSAEYYDISIYDAVGKLRPMKAIKKEIKKAELEERREEKRKDNLKVIRIHPLSCGLMPMKGIKPIFVSRTDLMKSRIINYERKINICGSDHMKQKKRENNRRKYAEKLGIRDSDIISTSKLEESIREKEREKIKISNNNNDNYSNWNRYDALEKDIYDDDSVFR